MPVREIIERHPRPISLDRDLVLRCIDECFDCAATCTSCADACLGEWDVLELVRCVRLNLDCADVCDATARVVTRQTEPDLGELLLPSPEGRRLLDQARAAADELGMPGLAKRAGAAYE